MRRDPKAHLWDACNAAEAVGRFTRDRAFDTFPAGDLPPRLISGELRVPAAGQIAEAVA
jgi:hypothetical protein